MKDQNRLLRTLTGVANWRHMLAPKSARLIVKLQDVSQTGAPAHTLAQRSYMVGGMRNAPFALAYGARKIEPTGAYAVSAEVRLGGRRVFATEGFQPALTHGAPTHVEIILAYAARRSRR